MRSTQTLSIIAIFTSLIIASDYALAPVSNVKLLDTLVFSSAYSFGFRIGASIAVLSEFIWGVVSPYGFGGLIIPFLVAGELIYAFAGYSASRIWKFNEVSGCFGTHEIFERRLLAESIFRISSCDMRFHLGFSKQILRRVCLKERILCCSTSQSFRSQFPLSCPTRSVILSSVQLWRLWSFSIFGAIRTRSETRRLRLRTFIHSL